MIRRTLSALVLLVVGAVAGSVLLSDRAPGLYGGVVDRGVEWAAGVADRVGVPDSIDRGDVPIGATDAGHMVLFAAVTVVAGVVLRHRARPWLVAVVVFAASAAFEVVQPWLSSSRSQELGDLEANAVGVVAGFVVLVLVLRIRRLRHSRSLAW